MKHTRLFVVCLLALALALTCAAFATAEEYAVVRGGGLNLRQTPSLSARVLGQYGTGTWVLVKANENGWSTVEVGGKSGYMMSKYLSTSPATQTLYVRTNTGIGLNLRQAPSTTGAVITSFKPGTAVSVLQRGSVWHKVQVGEQSGYMSAKYLVSALPQYTKPVAPFIATLNNINGGSVVNFRAYPGMKTKVLSQLPVGTAVTVLETGVNWSKVEVGDTTGYVSTYFLVY